MGLLKNQGGAWNTEVRGWVFKNRAAAEIAKAIRTCRDVGEVEITANSNGGNPAGNTSKGGALVVWEGGPVARKAARDEGKDTPQKCAAIAACATPHKHTKGKSEQKAQLTKIDAKHTVVEKAKQSSKAE